VPFRDAPAAVGFQYNYVESFTVDTDPTMADRITKGIARPSGRHRAIWRIYGE
jgi:hypothetical protein